LQLIRRDFLLMSASIENRLPDRASPTGFTLVEILVALTLLVLLGVLVTQLVNGVSTTIVNTGKHMDEEIQARMIFDRMANDFSRMVMRDDIDYVFLKQTGGNDRMFFYSEAPAYFDTTVSASAKSMVSLVGYQINSDLQLERLGMGLAWEGATDESENPPKPGGMVYLTYPTTSGSAYLQSTIRGNWPKTLSADSKINENFHVIGECVYRLEISFLLTDGALSNTPYLSPHTTFNIRDISAIVVAIAILDSSSRKMVTDYSQMVTALGDSVDGTAIAETWANSNYLTGSGIPKAAASHIHIYQRYFYLNHQ
jgi:prepilin-type N-terminal cleavage/methylation domain-containing protein